MAVDVLVVSDAGDVAGAERCVVAMARCLREAGYAVTVAHPDKGPKLAQRLAAVGVPSVLRSLERLAEGPSAPGLVDHDEPAAIIAAAAPRLVVFSDSTPAANIAAKEVAIDAGIPYISVAHLGAVHPAVDVITLRPRLRAVYESATRVIGVSTHTVDQLRAFTGSTLPEASVVFNGVADEFFAGATRSAARATRGTGPEQVVGVSVGRVDSQKGFAILTDALARLDQPKLTWLWIGGGPGLRRARVATALTRGAIRLLGEQDDVASMLAAADIFALPTYRDSFCLAAVEAMAMGLPVAISAVDGVPEIMGDAADLLPDPNRDAEATTQALVDVLGRWMADPVERTSLGRRGRARATAMFSQDRMDRDYVDLVDSCIGSP